MLKTILFDVDGVIIKRKRYFSECFSQEFGVPMDTMFAFFENEFQQCLVGKADLKKELSKYALQWGWEKSVDELLVYWFSRESEIDDRIMESLQAIRKRGIRCYLATNNETYRATYLLNALGLRERVDGIFASHDLGWLKTKKEFWEAVHVSLGKGDKNQVLVWDDDERNIQSAARFGFHAEHFTSFTEYQKKMRSLLALS